MVIRSHYVNTRCIITNNRNLTKRNIDYVISEFENVIDKISVISGRAFFWTACLLIDHSSFSKMYFKKQVLIKTVHML